jgi:hypothetical protein
MFISRLAAAGGKEKYRPHYEQLLQQLAELHVVRQIVSFHWPGGAKFALEPTAEEARKIPRSLFSTTVPYTVLKSKLRRCLHISSRATKTELRYLHACSRHKCLPC